MADVAMLPEIAPVVQRIVEEFHPERVVLFGSRAYGTPTPTSDVDLMIIMQTDRPLREQAVRIRQALAPSPHVPLDIHVRTPAQIRRGLNEHDFFIRDVMRGITLYEGEGMGTSEEAEDVAPEGAPAPLKYATRAWLAQAAQASIAAIQLRDAPLATPDYVCFLAQQGVETSLKALLQEREIAFPRTHDLVELMRLALAVVPPLGEHEAALETLTKCAVDARYPELTISMPDAEAAV